MTDSTDRPTESASEQTSEPTYSWTPLLSFVVQVFGVILAIACIIFAMSILGEMLGPNNCPNIDSTRFEC